MLSLRRLERQKEGYAGVLDLAPVRLIGGFICVDTHVGCAACSFCLNRRYPALRRVLEEAVQLDHAALGVPPERVLEWIVALPSYRRARVPLRIGCASDLAFEKPGALAIAGGIDVRHPALLMTRFAISPSVTQLLERRENLLLHLTLTPAVPGVLEGPGDLAEVIRSVAKVPPERLYVMLGPLVRGSAPAVARILPLLPPGAAVGFKSLKTDGLSPAAGAIPLSPDELASLARSAAAAGLVHLPLAGCRVRRSLGIPFFRYRRIASEYPEGCGACSNRSVCASVPAPALEEVQSEARAIGIEPEAIAAADGAIIVHSSEPTARADEVYLSELFCREVFLSSVRRAEREEVVALDEAILARWERTGFYPAEQLRAAAEKAAASAFG